MATNSKIDIHHLRKWIGREEEQADIVTPRLVTSLQATLDSARYFPCRTGALPVMTHWCLAPTIVAQSDLGHDGHPARGHFLPPIPFPRRMWAASDVEFHAPLEIGMSITRRSRVAEIELKEGRSGSLIFVTVDHRYLAHETVIVRDRQSIVYRKADPSASPTPPQTPPPPPPSEPPNGTSLMLVADPTLLLRYSALTFNAHRIHYDRAYATAEEHYPAIIVHGPLQASLLAEFGADLHDGTAPRRFSFRGLAPLHDGHPFTLHAHRTGADTDLHIRDAHGRTTMQAKATW